MDARIAAVQHPKRGKRKPRPKRPKEWLSFADLVDEGIVDNWQTLKNWQQQLGFPRGKLFGKNSRRFDRVSINRWIMSRPEE
jgi:hypothetical protein